MTAPTLSLKITQGEYWQRVISPRDRRTHWPAPSSTATAFMSDINGIKTTIPTSIQNDFSILLLMNEAATAALNPGNYYFEVSANPYLPYYNLGALVPPSNTRMQKVAIGTIEVESSDLTNFLYPGTELPSTPTPVLDQSGQALNLQWTEADAVSLGFTVNSVNWAGTYSAQVRAAASVTSTLMGTLTVTAVFDGTNTNFTLAMSQANSALIPAGSYYWDLQQVGGVTRLSGYVIVGPQVTSP